MSVIFRNLLHKYVLLLRLVCVRVCVCECTYNMKLHIVCIGDKNEMFFTELIYQERFRDYISTVYRCV
jgi:hypothetical protein